MRLENDLKPHNKDIYKKLQEILKTNNKTCIIQPTGSGKSYLILKQIEDRLIDDDWLERDEDLMQEYYPSMGTKVKSLLSVEKSNRAIMEKARRMKLSNKKIIKNGAQKIRCF